MVETKAFFAHRLPSNYIEVTVLVVTWSMKFKKVCGFDLKT